MRSDADVGPLAQRQAEELRPPAPTRSLSVARSPDGTSLTACVVFTEINTWLGPPAES